MATVHLTAWAIFGAAVLAAAGWLWLTWRVTKGIHETVEGKE